MVMTFFCVHASCGVFLHIQICAAKKKTKKTTTSKQHLKCLLTFESLWFFRFDFLWGCLCLSERTIMQCPPHHPNITSGVVGRRSRLGFDSCRCAPGPL